MAAKVTYNSDGSMSIEHPQEMDEDAFIYIMAEHFFGEEVALQTLAAGDDEATTVAVAPRPGHC